jgi:F0F1-type ATP synthase membrane subunit c/vacuolar-type H+-ATPase subunit K
MTAAAIIILFALCLVPLAVSARAKSAGGKKLWLAVNIAACVILSVSVLVSGVSASDGVTDGTADAAAGGAAQTEAAAETAERAGMTFGDGLGMLGIALVTGMSCIGAGIAVSASASAAIGAISENPKAFGKALIFVALAEGVALYGMLISIQMLAKI